MECRSFRVGNGRAESPKNGVAPARQEEAKQPSLTLKQVIRQAVERALQENGGNQTAAARQLGIGRTTMWRYLNNEE